MTTKEQIESWVELLKEHDPEGHGISLFTGEVMDRDFYENRGYDYDLMLAAKKEAAEDRKRRRVFLSDFGEIRLIDPCELPKNEPHYRRIK